MNKIFKIVWSYVRNTWVVVSELDGNKRFCRKQKKWGKVTLAAIVTAGIVTGMPIVGMAQHQNEVTIQKNIQKQEKSTKNKKMSVEITKNSSENSSLLFMAGKGLQVTNQNNTITYSLKALPGELHYFSISDTGKLPGGDAPNYANDGAKGQNSIAIGVQATTVPKAIGAIAIGSFNIANDETLNAKGMNFIGANVNGPYGISIGSDSCAGSYSTSLGTGAQGGTGSTAIGFGAMAGTLGISIGFNAHTMDKAPGKTILQLLQDPASQHSIAIGNDASTLSAGSIALGRASVGGYSENSPIYKSAIKPAYLTGEIKNVNGAKVDPFDPAWGWISVGRAGNFPDDDINNGGTVDDKNAGSKKDKYFRAGIMIHRRISNVAGGVLGADAVNVFQLRSLDNKIRHTYIKKNELKEELTKAGIRFNCTGQSSSATSTSVNPNAPFVLGDGLMQQGYDENNIPKIGLNKQWIKEQIWPKGTLPNNHFISIGAPENFTNIKNYKNDGASLAVKSIAIGPGASVKNGILSAISIGTGNSNLIGNPDDIKEQVDRFDSDTKRPIRVNQAGAYVGADFGIAIGMDSLVDEDASRAIAIGVGSWARDNNSIALGSSAVADTPGSIAIGQNSQAGYYDDSSQYSEKAFLIGEKDKFSPDNGWVSFGNSSIIRRISHIAGGAEDTDAVNVQQLKALQNNITNDFVKKSEIGQLIQQNIGNEFVKKSDIPNMNEFAKKSDIPNVNEFAKKSDIPNVNEFAKKSDIPNVNEFAKKLDIPNVNEFAKKSDIPNVNEFAKKSDIPNMNEFAKKSDIPNVNEFAKKSDIPNVNEFAKKSDIPKQVNQYVQSHSDELKHSLGISPTSGDRTSLKLQYANAQGNMNSSSINSLVIQGQKGVSIQVKYKDGQGNIIASLSPDIVVGKVDPTIQTREAQEDIPKNGSFMVVGKAGKGIWLDGATGQVTIGKVVTVPSADGSKQIVKGVTMTAEGQALVLNNVKLSGLKKGVAGSDAVTVGQLQDIGQAIDEKFVSAKDHTDNGVAGAAALAALHAQAFDSENKLDVAAGFGRYGKANVAALGMFYHPNENMTFSLGSTFGKEHNVINAGVSLRVGQGHMPIPMSKAAMVQALIRQGNMIVQQEKQIRQLTAWVQALQNGQKK